MGKNIGYGQCKYHGHTVEFNAAINMTRWQLHKTTGWISQCDTEHGSQKHKKYPLYDSTYTTINNKHNESMLLGIRRNVTLRESGSEWRLSEGASGKACNVQFLVHLDVGFMSTFSLWKFLELSMWYLHVFIFMLHFNNKKVKNRGWWPPAPYTGSSQPSQMLRTLPNMNFFASPIFFKPSSPNSNSPHLHLCLQTHPFHSLIPSSIASPPRNPLHFSSQKWIFASLSPKEFHGFLWSQPQGPQSLA